MSITDEKLAAALVELETRAGASDTDREAWLAERRKGITATEVRDLYLESIGLPSYTSKAQLIGRKLGRIPEVGDLTHVPVIGWGKEREPVIAAEVQAKYGLSPESRVFRAKDDPRKLASPDGVGVNWDGDLMISEIKTAEKDIAPGTQGYVAKGYLAQKVWQMRVTGARRCLYATEYRVPVVGGFEPGGRRFWWTEWDEDAQALAVKLEAIADDFLAALDAAAGEEYVPPVVDDRLDTLAVNLLRFREMEAEAKRAREAVWAELLEAVQAAGGPVSQVSALARVTFTPGKPSVEQKPDVEAAKLADPKLFAEVTALSKRWNAHVASFTKEVPTVGKPNLTVTAVKQGGA